MCFCNILIVNIYYLISKISVFMTIEKKLMIWFIFVYSFNVSKIKLLLIPYELEYILIVWMIYNFIFSIFRLFEDVCNILKGFNKNVSKKKNSLFL